MSRIDRHFHRFSFGFALLLLSAACGCASEDTGGGGGQPGFVFPSVDEGGEEGAESSTQEGGGEQTAEGPAPIVLPELLSFAPASCLGGGGAVSLSVSHPEGMTSALLMQGEEVFLELTPGDGAVFAGSVDTSELKEGDLELTLVLTSAANTVLEQEVSWKVDLTTPTLTWDTPLAGDVISGSAVLQGNAKDNNGCGVYSVQTYLDDTLIEESFLPEPELVEEEEGEETPVPVYEAPTSLGFEHERDTSLDGTFLGTLKVRVIDQGGNVTEETRVVNIVKPLDMLYAGENPVPGNVNFMDSGYLDDDSILDVFVASNAGVIAAQATGKGTFGKWVTLDSNFADLLLTKDFDDDGDTDFVTYENEGKGGILRLFLRDAPGDYSLVQELLLEGEQVVHMLAAEMTGDGTMDLVMSTASATNSIGVLEGVGGGGQFKEKVKWAGGVPNIVSISNGDFNGDLNEDVVVISSDTNKVSVFLGDGAAGFYAANDTILEVAAGDIVPGFFTDDDKLDLVVTLPGAAQGGKVVFLTGQGNGYFAVSFDMAYGGGPRELDAGDFDEDGLLDVVATSGDQTATVFYGRDALKSGFRYVIGPDASFLRVGKFTAGEGWNGLGFAAVKKLSGSAGYAVIVLGSDGESFFHAAPVLWNVYLCPGVSYTNCSVYENTDIALGYFDKNPGLDVASITTTYTDYNLNPPEGVFKYDIYLFLSENGFVPAPFPAVTLSVPGEFAVESWSKKGPLLSIQSGDFNGDGDSDLAVANETGYVKPPGSDTWSIAPENVDIFLQQNGAFDPLSGTGAWAGRDAAAFPPNSDAQKQGKLKYLAVADVDGDERDDLVGVTPWVKNSSPAAEDYPAHLTPWLAYAQSQWLPGLASPVDSSAIADTGTESVVSGDIDQDGKLDLLSVNLAVNNVAVHYGDGLGTFTDGRLFSAVSPGVKITALGNLNPDEDAFPDLISVGKSEVFITYGREHVQTVDDPFEPPVTLAYAGSKPVGVISADLNLDGFEDVLVLDEARSATYLYAGMGGRTFAPEPLVIQTSAAPKKLEMGDLDEDGCLDAVVLTQAGITILRNQTCENGGDAPVEPEPEDGGEAEGGEEPREESEEEGGNE